MDMDTYEDVIRIWDTDFQICTYVARYVAWIQLDTDIDTIFPCSCNIGHFQYYSGPQSILRGLSANGCVGLFVLFKWTSSICDIYILKQANTTFSGESLDTCHLGEETPSLELNPKSLPSIWVERIHFILQFPWSHSSPYACQPFLFSLF